jgi:hypothetical protein
MRLLLDENISRQVARALSGQGYDVAHVFDLGLQGKSDPVIFHTAQVRQAAVVTGNRADFELLVIAWDTWRLGTHHGLILPRRGKHLRTADWIEALEHVFALDTALDGRVVYL